MAAKQSIKERFWTKVDVRGAAECWTWQASKGNGGYGLFSRLVQGKKTKVVAHRFAYEDWHGPIPDGLHLDHLCRNPSCVNPAHLEAVTPRENWLRSSGRSAVNSQKNQCHRGHAYTIENTRITPAGERRCRQCARMRLEIYAQTYTPKVTQCKWGHAYTEANSRFCKRGLRFCRQCENARRRLSRLRRKGAA